MLIDFSKVATEELFRRYRFHLDDIGTQTLEEELRRMWFIQEIGQELRSRGVDPLHPRRIP